MRPLNDAFRCCLAKWYGRRLYPRPFEIRRTGPDSGLQLIHVSSRFPSITTAPVSYWSTSTRSSATFQALSSSISV
jgi:hypothetical protein